MKILQCGTVKYVCPYHKTKAKKSPRLFQWKGKKCSRCPSSAQCRSFPDILQKV